MMTKDALKIGLALSGGGVRAAVFHFGVLGRLAQDGLLENISCISTVSGGSLGIGLVYSLSKSAWPTSEGFLNYVYPLAKHYITHKDIQRVAIFRLLLRPWRFLQGGAKILSESIQRCWHVTGLLNNLATKPRWIINATTYESGKNWRFTSQRMGDYIVNYVMNPAIPLADAMAASAAYPGLIGPLILKTRQFQWLKFVEGSQKDMEVFEPNLKQIHLWDGGVYDNLGVEALFKPRGTRLRDDCNFLIVSDASGGLETEVPSFLHRRALRLINIATDQVRSLRARTIVNYFAEQPNTGVYLKIGNLSRHILEQASMPEEVISVLERRGLVEQEVHAAAYLATTLRQLTEEEFDRVYRHGWEVADCTLLSRCSSIFPFTPKQ